MNSLEISSLAPLATIPREQKVTLIFDACALNELAAAPLNKKESFLRWVVETSELPTVNLIIIPALVADWELRGGVTIIDESGKPQFIRVDDDFAHSDYIKGEHDSKFEALFSTASQYRYHQGAYQTIIGSNPKIIIVETDYQRRQFAKLAAISYIQNEDERRIEINEFRRKRDQGEKQMEYITAHAPIHNPAYIISTDINYLAHRKKETVTVSGYPVGTAKIIDYIQAELAARASYFKSHFGIGSLNQYCHAAMKAGAYPDLKYYPNGYKETGPGKYRVEQNEHIRGETLASIFQRGNAILSVGACPEFRMPAPYDPVQQEILEPLVSLPAIFAARLQANRKWMESLFLWYQVPMGDAIIADLMKGNTGGVLKEPTGSGKTIILGAVAKCLDVRTLIIVPKRLTAHQIAKAFKEKLFINPDDIGIYHSKIPKAERAVALDKQFVIVTSMAMIRLVRRGLIKRGDFKYCGIDEAHRMRGEITAGVIREVFLPDSIVHAFTATDKFSDGSLVGETLFKRREHIHATTIKKAIQDGWTCRSVKNIVIRTHVEFREAPANRELTEKEQRRLASRTGRDQQALALSFSYVDPDTGTVFSEELSKWYCSGVTHAGHIATKLNELHGEGYAKVITGKTKNQEDILEEHRQGKFKALVSADIAIDSYDNPACSVCYMLRDSQSPWIVEQTGGRVVRMNPRNPNKAAFIVSLVDEGRPYSLVFADVAEGWLLTSDQGMLGGTVKFSPTEAKSLPPEYPSLESLDIVETEREFVEFLREREEERQRLIFPEKTAEWLTRTDLLRYLGTSSQNIPLIRMIEDIEAKFRQGEDVTLDNQKLQLGFRTIYKLTPFCFHVTAAAIVAKHFKLDLEEKTPVWKSRPEVVKALGISSSRGGFDRLWQRLEDEFDKVGSTQIDGVPLVCGRKRNTQLKRWKSFCIHDSELEKIRDAIGFKTDDWLAQHDMEAKLGTSRKNPEYVELWKNLKEQFERTGAAHIGLKKIKCAIKGADNRACFCIHDSEADFLKSHLRLDIPMKTDEWLNLRQTGKAINTDPTDSPLSKLWEKLDAELRQTGKAIIGDELLNAKIMQAGSNRVMCIHKDEMYKLRAVLGLNVEKKTDEWLHKTNLLISFGAQGGEKSRLFEELWESLEKQFTARGYGIIDGHRIRLENKKAGKTHILMCVHSEDIVHLRKYMKLDLEEKTEGWLSASEFLEVLGVTSNGFFTNIFNQIKVAYDAGEPYKIGEHVVRAGYKQSGTGIAFYVHNDCLPHLKKEYKLDLFDQGGTWHAKFEYAKLAGTYQTAPAFAKLWTRLELEHKKGNVPIISGVKIKCGYKRIGEELKFYVNVEHKQVICAELESIRQQIISEKESRVELPHGIIDMRINLPKQLANKINSEESVRNVLRERDPLLRYKMLVDVLRTEMCLNYEALAEKLEMSVAKLRQCTSDDDNIMFESKQHKKLIKLANGTLSYDYAELVTFFEKDYIRAFMRLHRQKKDLEACLEELGSQIKDMYKIRGLVWDEVAEKADIKEPLSTLCKRVPSAEIIHRLAQALDLRWHEDKALRKLQLKAYTKRYSGRSGAWAQKPENQNWTSFVTEVLYDSLLPTEKLHVSKR